MNAKAVEPKIENYQDWLDGLSQGKAQVCAERLLQSMNNFNRIEMDVAQRHKALIQYLQKVKLILPSLEMELERQEGLGHEITRKAVTTMVALYATLFQGLRICLAQRIKKPPLLNREQNKVEILAQTLQAAKEVLILSGKYHVVFPKNVWLLCHNIFTYIEHEKLQTKTHKNYPPLEVLYTHIILLGMIPQSRMNASAFDWLYTQLFQFAPKVKILPIEGLVQKNPAGFYFDRTTDFAPRFFSKAPINDKANWRKVDCQVIIDNFNNTIEEQDNLGKAFADDVVLMRLIVLEWSYTAHRRTSRTKTQDPVWLQSRIGSVWELLNNRDWHPGDVLVGGRFATHPALMTRTDISNTGYKISGDPQGACMQIGEIVVTRAESDPNWSLGVIRWLMIEADAETIDCGIEHFTYEAKAVEVMPVIGKGNSYYMPALQLPAQPKLGKGPSLVLTGRVFSRLREFKIKDTEGNERLVRLSRLTLQTPFYQFVEFLDSADL
ncbi:hypothetical protein [Neisseria sp. Ec49-e6-T10]|uniref:hypothetical protein n=1 Tax=Neisseria sp. Ec49-e6-T10 TaxID=3140744 RepID=UPI003EB864B7